MPIISKETFNKFTPEEKKEIRELYSDLIKAMSGEGVGSDAHIVLSMMHDRYLSLFGKEQLQPKPLTYEDVARELFKDGAWQIMEGKYTPVYNNTDYTYSYRLNFSSEKQAEKLLAINKLMNVAKFLNGKDWKNDEQKWHIFLNDDDQFCIGCWPNLRGMDVYFRTDKLAQQAVEILGEDVIRLALSSDW